MVANVDMGLRTADGSTSTCSTSSTSNVGATRRRGHLVQPAAARLQEVTRTRYACVVLACIACERGVSACVRACCGHSPSRCPRRQTEED